MQYNLIESVNPGVIASCYASPTGLSRTPAKSEAVESKFRVAIIAALNSDLFLDIFGPKKANLKKTRD